MLDQTASAFTVASQAGHKRLDKGTHWGHVRDGRERVRVRFWNIGGAMADLTGPLTRMHRRWVPRALAGTEVLVLTETEYEGRLHAADVQAWARAQGWRQVVCNTRPYAAHNVGVAVFVRQASGGPSDERLTRVEAQLVRDTPELEERKKERLRPWAWVKEGNGPQVNLPPHPTATAAFMHACAM